MGRYHEASELQRGGNLSSLRPYASIRSHQVDCKAATPRRASWTKSPTDRENVGTGVSDDATLRFSHKAHKQFLYVDSHDGL